MKRAPAVEGQFYPSNRNSLRKMIDSFLQNANPLVQGKPLVIVSPHAGYIYSGQCAAFSYATLRGFSFDNAVILSPNHTGLGAPVSVYPEGKWHTPLGDVEINQELATKLGKTFWLDREAHGMEHAIEVQLPFLQEVSAGTKIVPITIMDQSLETMRKLGKGLAKNLEEEKDIVIVSTDFSHYVPEDLAKEKDLYAIEAIKTLDEEKLYKAVEEYGVSMCGYGGAAASIVYAKRKGAKMGKLLNYDSSARASGDRETVVGYGSIVVTK